MVPTVERAQTRFIYMPTTDHLVFRVTLSYFPPKLA